ncbi:MAG TPA: vWA domain-containing protein [Candidatus Limnocylindrales bacterium]|nr:vWA domain-containing protein [Candidatus Limnocylindrales bacterium]
MFEIFGYEASHPEWLLLLPVVLVEFLFRVRRYALQKAHLHVKPEYLTFRERLRQWQSRIHFVLPTVFKTLTYLSVILALAEITHGYFWTEEKLETPNILLLVDSSGSMFERKTLNVYPGVKPITCLAEEEIELYPRMKGMCRALKKFVDMTEAAALSPYQKKKPLISLMAFARDPAVILFPSTDYRRLRDQVERFEWSPVILGGDTNIHIAFYAALSNLIFRYASEPNTPSTNPTLLPPTGSAFVPSTGLEQALRVARESIFTEDEMNLLRKALRPQSGHFVLPPELSKKMSSIQPKIQEWTILIFTDAVYDDLKSFETRDPSLWKLLEFAAYLKLPIYFISIENFLVQLKLAAQETGGDFLLVRKDDPLVNMEQAVKEIFEKHLNHFTTIQIPKRASYSRWFILAGFVFFLCWGIAEYTFARSLTGEI